MFTFLDMIRTSLNYVNLSMVLKNRIYTIIASIGNFYLLYVAIKFYINGYWGRGTLFLAAFLAILYFSYLNLLYYFTKDKKSKIDISPWIEKTLHIESKDPMTAAEEERRQIAPGYVQTNGIFTDEDFLPATVVHTFEQQKNIQELASQLIRMDYMKVDYRGLNEDEVLEKIHQTNQPVKALANPVALPYFELSRKGNSLVVLGGINQIERKEVATIKEVGLLTAKEAVKRYELYLATAVITGGPEEIAGRTGVIEKNLPYQVEVQVAYRKKDAQSTTTTINKNESSSSASLRSRRSKMASEVEFDTFNTNDEGQTDQPLRRTQHESFEEMIPRSKRWKRTNKH
ncbi:DUF6681 family protein [Ligilactobacillus sp. LYQ135]